MGARSGAGMGPGAGMRPGMGVSPGTGVNNGMGVSPGMRMATSQLQVHFTSGDVVCLFTFPIGRGSQRGVAYRSG